MEELPMLSEDDEHARALQIVAISVRVQRVHVRHGDRAGPGHNGAQGDQFNACLGDGGNPHHNLRLGPTHNHELPTVLHQPEGAHKVPAVQVPEDADGGGREGWGLGDSSQLDPHGSDVNVGRHRHQRAPAGPIQQGATQAGARAAVAGHGRHSVGDVHLPSGVLGEDGVVAGRVCGGRPGQQGAPGCSLLQFGDGGLDGVCAGQAGEDEALRDGVGLALGEGQVLDHQHLVGVDGHGVDEQHVARGEGDGVEERVGGRALQHMRRSVGQPRRVAQHVDMDHIGGQQQSGGQRTVLCIQGQGKGAVIDRTGELHCRRVVHAQARQRLPVHQADHAAGGDCGAGAVPVLDGAPGVGPSLQGGDLLPHQHRQDAQSSQDRHQEEPHTADHDPGAAGQLAGRVEDPEGGMIIDQPWLAGAPVAQLGGGFPLRRSRRVGQSEAGLDGLGHFERRKSLRLPFVLGGLGLHGGGPQNNTEKK
mmetsp:Transcript_88240/g.153309  ORF Transcript_88240/g.153309 Transcript_88240/m.153309 type:complete len:476 (-) Transcript_88240:7-1434(-)